MINWSAESREQNLVTQSIGLDLGRIETDQAITGRILVPAAELQNQLKTVNKKMKAYNIVLYLCKLVEHIYSILLSS